MAGTCSRTFRPFKESLRSSLLLGSVVQAAVMEGSLRPHIATSATATPLTPESPRVPVLVVVAPAPAPDRMIQEPL